MDPSRPVHGGLNLALVGIGVRRMADCRRLAGALRQVLGNGDG